MSHPYNEHRQHDVERSRVGKITKGYASGGGVLPESNPKLSKQSIKQRDAQAVEGGSAKERMDRPGRKRGGRIKRAAGGVTDTGNRGVADLTSNTDAAQQARENAASRTSQSVLKLRRANNPMAGLGDEVEGRARGGRAPKHKGNNVNVIIAPQGGAHPMMPPGAPPPGVAAGPPPMPPRPMAGPPPGAMPPPGMAGPGGPMPPGMPPRSAGGRAYATGGAVKPGPAWKGGLKSGTQMQNTPSGKNDMKDVGRGKPMTYATGGRITSENGPMGPKFDGGAGGGKARIQKEERAERKYAKAK